MPIAIARWASGEPCCVARGKLLCIQRGTEPDRPKVKKIELAPDALTVAMAVASDQKHAWAVGTAGTIATTEDGGRTWSTQSRDARTTLVGVYFLPDSLHGWVWGDEDFCSRGTVAGLGCPRQQKRRQTNQFDLCRSQLST